MHPGQHQWLHAQGGWLGWFLQFLTMTTKTNAGLTFTQLVVQMAMKHIPLLPTVADFDSQTHIDFSSNTHQGSNFSSNTVQNSNFEPHNTTCTIPISLSNTHTSTLQHSENLNAKWEKKHFIRGPSYAHSVQQWNKLHAKDTKCCQPCSPFCQTHPKERGDYHSCRGSVESMPMLAHISWFTTWHWLISFCIWNWTGQHPVVSLSTSQRHRLL